MAEYAREKDKDEAFSAWLDIHRMTNVVLNTALHWWKSGQVVMILTYFLMQENGIERLSLLLVRGGYLSFRTILEDKDQDAVLR